MSGWDQQYDFEELDRQLKQWEKQERGVAKRRGGKQTRGSGSSWRNKSDVVEQDVRWEMKATGKKQITIKAADLDKIRSEALRSGRMPAVHLQIGDRNWVIITEHDFDEGFPPQEVGDDGISRG